MEPKMKSIRIGLLATALGCAFALQFPATATAQTETVLYSFGSGTDGGRPLARLINVNGTFYGTTAYGGIYNKGTLFSFNPQTDAETVLWSFGSGTDGQNPYDRLVDVNGTLYGTTAYGGNNGQGTVFSFNLTTGIETALWSFGSGKDGVQPGAGLIKVNGVLYGTTYNGGLYGDGTIFSLNLKTDAETVVWSFGNGTDGHSPNANMINVNGTLYGTTWGGGSYNDGTVFSFNPQNDAETVLWSFSNNPDGQSPNAGLVNVKGTFYGTTFWGGMYGWGTLFSLNPATNSEAVLWSFGNGKDGEEPGSLINVKGKLYGTTEVGGALSQGTVFSFSRKNNAETIVWSFSNDGTDGENPVGGLINVNGTLYGTTSYGGTYQAGTVYELVP